MLGRWSRLAAGRSATLALPADCTRAAGDAAAEAVVVGPEAAPQAVRAATATRLTAAAARRRTNSKDSPVHGWSLMVTRAGVDRLRATPVSVTISLMQQVVTVQQRSD